MICTRIRTQKCVCVCVIFSSVDKKTVTNLEQQSFPVLSCGLEVLCCCCSVFQLCLFVTPWTATFQASLSFTISRSLLKLMSIESVMPSNQLILCCPLLVLPSMFPSIGVFTNESTLCMRWPKYQSFSIGSSNEYSGWISFRINWLDLCAVQGTLKNLLQHHSLKSSVLQRSAFFMVQLTSVHDH